MKGRLSSYGDPSGDGVCSIRIPTIVPHKTPTLIEVVCPYLCIDLLILMRGNAVI